MVYGKTLIGGGKIKTVAIIQARLGSTRLPGKVLFEVAGRCLIGLMLERVRRSKFVDEIVIATGKGMINDSLEAVVVSLGFSVFRGSEENVLKRYAQAAKTHDADVVVRLTGDCPLMDPQVVDLIVRKRAEDNYDYCTNVLPPTWPDGLDVSVFTREILEAADREAERPSDREHVVPWMWRQTSLKGGSRYTAINVESPKDLSLDRWTIDEASDYIFLRALASKIGPEGIVTANTQDILDVIKKMPQIKGMNANIVRDAGYALSLADEAAK